MWSGDVEWSELGKQTAWNSNAARKQRNPLARRKQTDRNEGEKRSSTQNVDGARSRAEQAENRIYSRRRPGMAGVVRALGARSRCARRPPLASAHPDANHRSPAQSRRWPGNTPDMALSRRRHEWKRALRCSRLRVRHARSRRVPRACCATGRRPAVAALYRAASPCCARYLRAPTRCQSSSSPSHRISPNHLRISQSTRPVVLVGIAPFPAADRSGFLPPHPLGRSVRFPLAPPPGIGLPGCVCWLGDR